MMEERKEIKASYEREHILLTELPYDQISVHDVILCKDYKNLVTRKALFQGRVFFETAERLDEEQLLVHRFCARAAENPYMKITHFSHYSLERIKHPKKSDTDPLDYFPLSEQLKEAGL